MQTPYIDVYLPIAGWKAVLYGEYGPIETSFRAWDTPEEAYNYALSWGKEIGVPVKEHTSFGSCPTHGLNVVDGKCDVCSSDELIAMMRKRFPVPRP